MQSDTATVDGYLAELPEERREALSAVRETILQNLPEGFEESMQYGMISYVIPLERYPDTYNGQPLTLASLGSQKRHMALYLMGVYGDEGTATWFRKRWEATGKKLDMGKSCVRFRKLDDLSLDVVGEAIGRIDAGEFIAAYERSRS